MDNVRWGLEAEFGEGADRVTQALFARGFSGCNYLHDYHCNCRHCAIDEMRAERHGIMPFHAQTDSSCSGEIISRPLRFSETYSNGSENFQATDFLQALATAAVDVDAEPDESAGVHVHVSVDDIAGPRLNRGSATTAFFMWEPFLVRLASGRFSRQRPNNNHSMRRWTADYYYCSTSDERPSPDMNATARRNFADWWTEQDRHSNLCTNTRHNTWEFRLWNSTRSARRLEMYVRTSLALMNSQTYNALKIQDCTVLSWTDQKDYFINCLDDERTVELVNWQLGYIERRESLAVPAGFRA